MLMSNDVVEREHIPAGEYYALTLFAICGMMMMAAATDLLVVFLALEILSLAVYVLTGHPPQQRGRGRGRVQILPARRLLERVLPLRDRLRVRAVRLDPDRTDRRGAVAAGRRRTARSLALLAVGLLAVGFAFKVSAVPFHMWTPDAYEGAPTIVTAFMSTAVKAAAFAAFVRVFLSPLEPLKAEWIPMLSVIAALTMILGTVVGVVQTNVKRMLAYSSIAHAGYLLLGIVSANATGKAAILFYLLAYAVTNMGALGIVALLGTAGESARRAARFRRPVAVPARARRADDHLPALARRLAADRRLHRQVVHLQRRRPGRPLLARHHRRAHERHLGVLLPAHRRDDVHDRRLRRRPPARARQAPWPVSRWR